MVRGPDLGHSCGMRQVIPWPHISIISFLQVLGLVLGGVEFFTGVQKPKGELTQECCIRLSSSLL